METFIQWIGLITNKVNGARLPDRVVMAYNLYNVFVFKKYSISLS